MKRLKPTGVAFWLIALYSLGGVVSGVLLGSDWLAASNDFGISRWSMLLPGVCLLGAAVIGQVAIASRKRPDAVQRYCSLVCWASMLGGACQSGVGWLGRFDDGTTLVAVHIALQVIAAPFVIGAVLATFRVALSMRKMQTEGRTQSERPDAFTVPAVLLALVGTVAIMRYAVEYLFGIGWSTGLWMPVSMAMSITALWLASKFPYTKRQKQWQGSHEKSF